jgi:hypothetical protein
MPCTRRSFATPGGTSRPRTIAQVGLRGCGGRNGGTRGHIECCFWQFLRRPPRSLHSRAHRADLAAALSQLGPQHAEAQSPWGRAWDGRHQERPLAAAGNMHVVVHSRGLVVISWAIPRMNTSVLIGRRSQTGAGHGDPVAETPAEHLWPQHARVAKREDSRSPSARSYPPGCGVRIASSSPEWIRPMIASATSSAVSGWNGPPLPAITPARSVWWNSVAVTAG